MNKIYLGDGAFVEVISANEIRLSTTNGLKETNQIILDIEMVQKLFEWFERQKG